MKLDLKKIAPISAWKTFSSKRILIAGPCSAESPEQLVATAKDLPKHGVNVLRAGIWKPRTHPGSFEGIGAVGLSWLKDAGNECGLPVATEVAEPKHVEDALKAGIDLLWIGARTTVNPFAVQALADSLKGTSIPLMIKNPVSADIELWIGAIERFLHAGVTKIAAIHRGFTTSRKTIYRNAPQWRIPIELKTRIPHISLICDPSHICGNTRLLLSVAQESIDLLFDGLMIEVHHNPKGALSDASQQITPLQLGTLLSKLRYTQPQEKLTEIDPLIKNMRHEIDIIDSHIIDYLSQRMEKARELGRYKQEKEISSFQPSRWHDIIKTRMTYAKKKNISEEFLLRIYQHIHEEALRQQELIHQEL